MTEPRESASSPEDASTPKPWKSGRVLTADQRRRKREVNRTTARVQKEELQHRVVELEARVAEFEKWKSEIILATSGGDTSPKSPLDSTQITPPALQQYTDIPSSYKTQTWIDTTSNISNTSYNDQSPGFSHDDDGGVSRQSSVQGIGSPLFEPSSSMIMEDLLGDESADMIATDVNKFPQKQLDVSSALRTLTLVHEGRDVTRFLNSAVLCARSLPFEVVCFDDGTNQDVIIRAVLQGWDRALERHQTHCPLWLILRQVDFVLFKNCNVLERIAMLRTIHLKSLNEKTAFMTGEEGLPEWYRPRPSQALFKHDLVIDHIAWPGMRDKLTVSENNILTNKFWAAFTREFRFAWPCEPLEAFHYSTQTGRYGLSDLYCTHLTDISSWRMKVRFCTAFPDFALDIVPADYMPLQDVVAGNDLTMVTTQPQQAIAYNQNGLSEVEEEIENDVI